jgi:hypothetical protein
MKKLLLRMMSSRMPKNYTYQLELLDRMFGTSFKNRLNKRKNVRF